MARKPLFVHTERTDPPTTSPAHHILPAKSYTSMASFFSPAPSPGTERPSLNATKKTSQSQRAESNALQKPRKVTRFRNPWPSFHKPTMMEGWNALAWGRDEDPDIELAASRSSISGDSPSVRAKQAAQLLSVTKPDFSFDPTQRAKSTWLGHAGVLLQLATITSNSQEPVRILMDPVFSQRCSPSQGVGPIRRYPPPCPIEELPPIDIVVISHSHYDHLDLGSIKRVWKLHSKQVHFVVPLKMKKWFVETAELGIPSSAVTELDWWESVTVSEESDLPSSKRLKISCCPAQHNSGRGGDADTVLWAGWYFEHDCGDSPYRVFFAGDTGFQFHSSPAWPPVPPKGTKAANVAVPPALDQRCPADDINDGEDKKYPPCPAFAEVAQRYGSPDLIFLPVALGATWAYFKSFFSALPDSVDPVPRHSAGLAGSVHMPPWDAVRVMKIMFGQDSERKTQPVAVAIHWGTFTSDPVEVLKTLGQLEWACNQHHVRFGRSLEEAGESGNGVFLAINQGESVTT